MHVSAIWYYVAKVAKDQMSGTGLVWARCVHGRLRGAPSLFYNRPHDMALQAALCARAQVIFEGIPLLTSRLRHRVCYNYYRHSK